MYKKTLFLLTFLGLFSVNRAVCSDIEGNIANIGMLDKVTGRFTSAKINVGEMLSFENLQIKVLACVYKPPEETPENTAYLEIFEHKHNKMVVPLFKGWMFSSAPIVSMDSPVYDVWVLSCE